MTCGIYCITNNINGMKYVGQSRCIEERFNQHINGKSTSKIHEAIVEHGVQNFKFEIIVSCSPNELDEQEVKFIRLLDSYENGYNQTRGGQHSVFNVEYDFEKYSELKNRIKSKNEKIRCLNNEKNSLENHISHLKKEQSKLLNEIDSLKTKNLFLKKTIKDLKNNTIKPLREQIIDLKKGDSFFFKKHIHSLENKINSLKNKNKSLESEIEELKFDNEHIRRKYVAESGVSETNIFHELLREQEEGLIKNE